MKKDYQYTFTRREYLTKIAGMPLLSLTTKNESQMEAMQDLQESFYQIMQDGRHEKYTVLLNWFESIVEDFLLESSISSATLVLTPFERVHWKTKHGLNNTKLVTLHSAHFLPHVPEGHKCGRNHGHNFHVICDSFRSQDACNNVTQILMPIYERLDKRLLNDVEGLENPTSENLSSWLFHTMKPQWSQLIKMTVYETDSAGSSYAGGEVWESFKQFSFDSCFTGPKGQCMGHTFKVKLHVQDQLQEPFGWTIDFGDIKKLFKPYLNQLDHHCLNHADITSPTLQGISQWIMDKMKPELPSLYQVSLESTPYQSVKLTAC